MLTNVALDSIATNTLSEMFQLGILDDSYCAPTNDDDVCVSPNDVPGYDKNRYMPDALKDEKGKAYAYRDTAGNYYELDFGLCY